MSKEAKLWAYLRDASFYAQSKVIGRGVKYHAMGADGCGSLCGKVAVLNEDTEQPIADVPPSLRCRACWPHNEKGQP